MKISHMNQKHAVRLCVHSSNDDAIVCVVLPSDRAGDLKHRKDPENSGRNARIILKFRNRDSHR